MPIFKKTSKYEDELNQAKSAIENGGLLLPLRIFVKAPSKFILTLRVFLRKNTLSDDYTTSVDPDKDSVWLARRK